MPRTETTFFRSTQIVICTQAIFCVEKYHGIIYVTLVAKATVVNRARGGMHTLLMGDAASMMLIFLFASSMADESIKSSARFWPNSGNLTPKLPQVFVMMPQWTD
jgi:hypothetical protein